MKIAPAPASSVEDNEGETTNLWQQKLKKFHLDHVRPTQLLMSNSNPNYTDLESEIISSFTNKFNINVSTMEPVESYDPAVKLFVKQVPNQDLVLCATCEATVSFDESAAIYWSMATDPTRPVAAGSEETFTKLSDHAQIYRKVYLTFMGLFKGRESLNYQVWSKQPDQNSIICCQKSEPAGSEFDSKIDSREFVRMSNDMLIRWTQISDRSTRCEIFANFNFGGKLALFFPQQLLKKGTNRKFR